MVSAYQISQQSASVNISPLIIVPYDNAKDFTLLEEQQRHTQVLYHTISVDESHDVSMDRMVYIIM